MKHAFTGAAVLVAFALQSAALAQSSASSYPRVYGPTGRLYGPTQAEYQYQRQYGRPWHGLNGLPGGLGGNYVNGYPGGGRHYHAGSFYCPPYFYPPVYVYPPVYGGFYGPYWGGFGYAPTMPLLQPLDTSLPPDQQAALQDMLRDTERQWTSPLESLPVEQLPKRFIKPSSEAARLRSVRAQHQGDLHLQALDFDAAGRDYEDALLTAQDRPEPYFRLAIVEAIRRDYSGAVQNLKLGLQLDPDWPHTAPTLDELFGDRNRLPKTEFKSHVLEWVREDIRDPDRLFLLGVLLHIDHDADRAAQLFETAARLGGMKQHLHAFLTEPPVTEQAGVPIENDPDAPHEPPPPPAPAIDETQPTVPTEPQAAPPATTPPLPRTSGPRLPTPNPILPTPLPTASR